VGGPPGFQLLPQERLSTGEKPTNRVTHSRGSIASGKTHLLPDFGKIRLVELDDTAPRRVGPEGIPVCIGPIASVRPLVIQLPAFGIGLPYKAAFMSTSE
jgi:hypothetical protein